jgi:putative FmdB family regulatory protein
MPIYEYKCLDCGKLFESYQKIANDKNEAECPKCGSQNTRRVPSSFFGKFFSGYSCGSSSFG